MRYAVASGAEVVAVVVDVLQLHHVRDGRGRLRHRRASLPLGRRVCRTLRAWPGCDSRRAAIRGWARRGAVARRRTRHGTPRHQLVARLDPRRHRDPRARPALPERLVDQPPPRRRRSQRRGRLAAQRRRRGRVARRPHGGVAESPAGRSRGARRRALAGRLAAPRRRGPLGRRRRHRRPRHPARASGRAPSAQPRGDRRPGRPSRASARISTARCVPRPAGASSSSRGGPTTWRSPPRWTRRAASRCMHDGCLPIRLTRSDGIPEPRAAPGGPTREGLGPVEDRAEPRRRPTGPLPSRTPRPPESGGRCGARTGPPNPSAR